MKVLKFGGSSLASATSIKLVIDIIKSEQHKLWVVVSASGKTTDNLIQLTQLSLAKDESYKTELKLLEQHHIAICKELLPIAAQTSIIAFIKSSCNELEQLLDAVYWLEDLSPKTQDKIISYGELLSAQLLQKIASQEIDSVQYKDSRELIATDSKFTNAKVNFNKTNKNIADFQKQNTARVIISGGYISANENQETTTLGRGGSDYSAAIYAAALDAEALEIWTDVSGLYAANPKLVKQAKPIANISYEEAMELSHFGAKVIYPPTIKPVLEKEIPIKIKNTFDAKAAGTLISNSSNGKRQTIKGISHVEGISLLTLEGLGMIGIHGISKRLFEVLANNHINIVLITQASSEHSICIAVAKESSQEAEQLINIAFKNEISEHLIQPISVEHNLAILAVVGDQMKSHQGVSGTLFSALGSNNINIRAIAQGASEKNISCVIKNDDVRKALNCIHAAFFEAHIKELNVFIAGVGNVGGKLVSQLQQQQAYLKEALNLNVKIVGIANSKQYYINENGLENSDWKANLSKQKVNSDVSYYDAIDALNKQNSIFVDVTANEGVANSYANLLRKSISVVACNKIACSSDYTEYKELKYLAKKYKASFLYETNVGAGLPIIKTVQNLISSGDQITEIQAVLSGSLNFIFNEYTEKSDFHKVVKQAQDEGYTEPDPRIDLSGKDVARKILILIREAGIPLEFEAIQNKSMLPKGSLEAKSVADFYTLIEKEEGYFKALLTEANNKGARLKYVASYKDGKASVGLQFIPKDHPFYNLEGKDNIVSFYTNRYQDQPLIIKGAGAGADVTASGLFGDIIQIGSAN
ncbi:MAG: bifunctional aspartate kinase/homoserine dehydrogenase I [Flavobacteriaceae bacterium]|nr:bifunctional aspartate kinase/homoserine dehydrogenase I [Flavobacteriaceae bacterium]